jgi:hypothetical protein
LHKGFRDQTRVLGRVGRDKGSSLQRIGQVHPRMISVWVGGTPPPPGRGVVVVGGKVIWNPRVQTTRPPSLMSVRWLWALGSFGELGQSCGNFL